MTPWLFARFVLLAALAALVTYYVWAAATERQ